MVSPLSMAASAALCAARRVATLPSLANAASFGGTRRGAHGPPDCAHRDRRARRARAVRPRRGRPRSASMPDLTQLLGHWGYAALFVVVVLGNVGLPLPEETVLALAGYLVWRGDMRLPVVLVVGVVSAVAGDNLGYWVGHRFGRKRAASVRMLGAGAPRAAVDDGGLHRAARPLRSVRRPFHSRASGSWRAHSRAVSGCASRDSSSPMCSGPLVYVPTVVGAGYAIGYGLGRVRGTVANGRRRGRAIDPRRRLVSALASSAGASSTPSDDKRAGDLRRRPGDDRPAAVDSVTRAFPEAGRALQALLRARNVLALDLLEVGDPRHHVMAALRRVGQLSSARAPLSSSSCMAFHTTSTAPWHSQSVNSSD